MCWIQTTTWALESLIFSMQLISWISSPKFPIWTAFAAPKSPVLCYRNVLTRYSRPPSCKLSPEIKSLWLMGWSRCLNLQFPCFRASRLPVCLSLLKKKKKRGESLLKKGNRLRMGWEVYPEGPWAIVLKQRKVGLGLCSRRLGQCGDHAGTTLCVLLPAQALLNTGETQVWESCWHRRLWAAQHWQGRVFISTSCRRNTDVSKMRLPRLGSWWVRSFEISLMSACAQGSKCQVDI